MTQLIHSKSSVSYPQLRVSKYTRHVFFNGLWNKDTLMARGIVSDLQGNIVALAMPKVFNYGENNAGKNFEKKDLVHCYRKVNGFLIAVSLYQGELLFSTTGSLDSEFVVMARELFSSRDKEHIKSWLEYLNESDKVSHTMSFEVCHPIDPHIIKEEYGVYFLGVRQNIYDEQHFFSWSRLHEIRDMITNMQKTGDTDMLLPQYKKNRFDDIILEVNSCKHEGFMIYHESLNELIKIKSPYYLATKFLARMTQKRYAAMQSMTDKQIKQSIKDEEFFDLVKTVLKNKDWLQLDEPQRIDTINRFILANR